MKKTLLLAIGIFILSACSQKSAEDKFIDEVMSKMTLEQKIGQTIQLASDMAYTGEPQKANCMNEIRAGRCGSLLNIVGNKYIRMAQEAAMEATGIPLLIGFDVIHGYRTCFPISIAENASWDLEAIRRGAEVAAREASCDGLAWTFAPMCDVSFEPRWGRVMEGSTEDPYLSGKVSAARVKGFQGDDLASPYTIAACVKHFACYGAPQAGREYNTVDMSRGKLMNMYLPSYKEAIDAGAATVMTSFNDFDDVPATGNTFIMKDLLRDYIGFDGMLVTDYNAIMEMIKYGVAADKKEAALLAINAEVDMDMVCQSYLHLAELVKEGVVSEKQIDQACRRVLKLKYDLGLFEDPYRYNDEARYEAEILCPEHKAAAQDMAEKSFVLLKNEGSLLPLAKGTKIAVIGELANSQKDMISSWVGQCKGEDCETILEGLKNYNGPQNVRYVRGTAPHDNSTAGFAKAIEAARWSDVVVLAIGENGKDSGEGEARANINLTGSQTALLEALSKVEKPVVTLLFNGRPMDVSKESELTDALLEVWFPGTMAGTAVARTLFGEVNPSGKLPMTFPRCLGQVPITYWEKPSSRPSSGPQHKYQSNYRDVENTPLYPFGYGLSYTTFEYSPVALSAEVITKGQSVKATVTVTNTGTCEGAEVVQLYLRDVLASCVRPGRLLKGFEKITLAAGESREVTLEIPYSELGFWKDDKTYVTEPGEFIVYVGGCSTTKNSAKFTLK